MSVSKIYLPWVEKYRPNNINGIIEQDEIKKYFLILLKKFNEMTNLMIYGPPGTGKTSVAFAFVYALFGPKAKDRVLELNASDNKGISTVRNEIIRFANSELGNPDVNFPSPDFKIIILDEADALTGDAQAALRKLMEGEVCKKTKFIILCNYDHQIMEPIVSRCTKFRFKPITVNNVVIKLKFIGCQEGLNITDDGYYQIAKISEGDIRKAIMILQNTKYICKINQDISSKNKQKNITQKDVNVDDINDICSYINRKDVEELFDICLNGNVRKIRDFIKKVIKESYPIKYLLREICEIIINSDKYLSNQQIALIGLRIINCERRLLEESNEKIQLLNLFTYIHAIYKNVKLYKDDFIF